MERIISGGQTGVDIAALRAAQRATLKTGGVAPNNFETLKGPNPELKTKFGLIELKDTGCKVRNIGAAYIERSKANVDRADGVLAIRLHASPGTDGTINYAGSKRWKSDFVSTLNFAGQIAFDATATDGKPVLILSSIQMSDFDVLKNIVRHFVLKYRIRTLNVCGHRDMLGIPQFETVVENFLYALFCYCLLPVVNQ
jgi:hypothetical protein